MLTSSPFAIILSIIGNIVSTGTAFSPIKNFLEIDRNRDVGNNNIYPIIALCGNSLCWVVYGAVIKSMSILPVNVIGLFVTSYFIIVFISATSDIIKRRFITAIYFGYLVGLTIYHIMIVLYVESIETQSTIFGYTSIVAVLIFYASPVLSLYGVFKSMDRSSINLPLSLVSCFAGLTWTLYGIVVDNKFIFLPNAVGASLSAISLVAYFLVGYFNTLYKIKSNQTNDGASQDVALIINQEEQQEISLNKDDDDYEEEIKI
ncbi:hypothetical protein RB653_001636 [Dictyostelium firmibasis]|uniref:Bidirectional sugar transporter SWEET n=1 Tax=Dictyostelium firmibasis TaxID=79012 RepID=A0AAN7YRJ3_9MYCE